VVGGRGVECVIQYWRCVCVCVGRRCSAAEMEGGGTNKSPAQSPVQSLQTTPFPISLFLSFLNKQDTRNNCSYLFSPLLLEKKRKKFTCCLMASGRLNWCHHLDMTTVFILKTSILLFSIFIFFGYKEILWIISTSIKLPGAGKSTWMKFSKSLKKFEIRLLALGWSVGRFLCAKKMWRHSRVDVCGPSVSPPPSLFLIFLFFPTGFWRDIRNKGKRGIERESVRIKCVALKKIIAFSHDFVCKLKKGGKKQTRKCAPVLIFFFWVF
jgi:hypothetical protein